MSEDDLDAFFDEVEEVEQEIKAKIEDEKDEKKQVNGSKIPEIKVEEFEHPPKKIKIESGSGGEISKPVISYGGALAPVISKKAEVSNLSTTSSGQVYHILVPERNQIPVHPHAATLSTIPQQSISIAPLQESIELVGKPAVRLAAGKTWVDNILAQFPKNDFRLFVGNLGSDVTEQKLAEAFQSRYPSFAMARIVYDKSSGESKGYGFISVMDPKDCAKAIREMNQSWLGSRPIKVTRSEWKDRDLKEVRKQKKNSNRR